LPRRYDLFIITVFDESGELQTVHQKEPVQDQRPNAAAANPQRQNPASIIAQILPSRDLGESTYSQDLDSFNHFCEIMSS